MAQIFQNRQDAGWKLGQACAGLLLDAPLVLALPRGGVPVGFEVAQALGSSLDLLLVRKLGAPGQPEYAIGAIAGTSPPRALFNDAALAVFRPSRADLDRIIAAETAELERRRLHYRGSRAPTDVLGRTVILVDDGIATGSTVEAALRVLGEMEPQRVVLAVPVAASSSLQRLAPLCDQVVCLLSVHDFEAVGQHYRDFSQVSDAEVIDLLARAGDS